MKAAKTLGMFRPPESLNSARIERMTPSMGSLFSEEFIDGVLRQIRALFNDSGDRNIPRVLAGRLAHCAPPRPAPPHRTAAPRRVPGPRPRQTGWRLLERLTAESCNSSKVALFLQRCCALLRAAPRCSVALSLPTVQRPARPARPHRYPPGHPADPAGTIGILPAPRPHGPSPRQDTPHTSLHPGWP